MSEPLERASVFDHTFTLRHDAPLADFSGLEDEADKYARFVNQSDLVQVVMYGYSTQLMCLGGGARDAILLLAMKTAIHKLSYWIEIAEAVAGDETLPHYKPAALLLDKLAPKDVTFLDTLKTDRVNLEKHVKSYIRSVCTLAGHPQHEPLNSACYIESLAKCKRSEQPALAQLQAGLKTELDPIHMRWGMKFDDSNAHQLGTSQDADSLARFSMSVCEFARIHAAEMYIEPYRASLTPEVHWAVTSQTECDALSGLIYNLHYVHKPKQVYPALTLLSLGPFPVLTLIRALFVNQCPGDTGAFAFADRAAERIRHIAQLFPDGVNRFTDVLGDGILRDVVAQFRNTTDTRYRDAGVAYDAIAAEATFRAFYYTDDILTPEVLDFAIPKTHLAVYHHVDAAAMRADAAQHLRSPDPGPDRVMRFMGIPEETYTPTTFKEGPRFIPDARSIRRARAVYSLLAGLSALRAYACMYEIAVGHVTFRGVITEELLLPRRVIVSAREDAIRLSGLLRECEALRTDGNSSLDRPLRWWYENVAGDIHPQPLEEIAEPPPPETSVPEPMDVADADVPSPPATDPCPPEETADYSQHLITSLETAGAEEDQMEVEAVADAEPIEVPWGEDLPGWVASVEFAPPRGTPNDEVEAVLDSCKELFAKVYPCAEQIANTWGLDYEEALIDAFESAVFRTFHNVRQSALYPPYYKTDTEYIDSIQQSCDVMFTEIHDFLTPLAGEWDVEFNTVIADAFSVLTHKAFRVVETANSNKKKRSRVK